MSSGPQITVLSRRDIRSCPKISLLPGHYRPDGTCRCGERGEAEARVAAIEAQKRAINAELAAARAEVARS